MRRGCKGPTRSDKPGVAATAPAYWTAWFSEERSGDAIDGSNFPKLADAEAIAVGIQCRGSYCDDLRLLMQPLRGANVPTMQSKAEAPVCRRSTRFSEETGNATPVPSDPTAAYGEFIHRVGCSGGYCDNLQIEWCRVFPPRGN